MHPYSVDGEERKYIFVFLVVISIILSWSFYKSLIYYKITLPWWVESPSVLFFYGLLYWVFDRWIWKLFVKIRFLKIPNLNGKWDGYLKSSFDNHSAEIKTTLQIFQTWTRIKIILSTEQSKSHSESASIMVSDPEGCCLSYQYINEPISTSKKTMSIHRGTARQMFDYKNNTLNGEYYSGRDRQQYGVLYFKKSTNYKDA
ncbi:MAG: Cap15 family cyclic dinucleotide receptor domain-containing protein [Candidatus Humimicrobiaceae bacterium]